MKNIYLIIACICSLLPLAGAAQTFTSVDVYTGVDSSNPYNFIEYNNKLYFSAFDNVHGGEVWVSDGTQGGSHILADIWQGSGSSDPHDFTVYNNKLYFSANDSVHGQELWVTDGTPGGTSMVADIYPGPNQGNPYNLIVYNNKLIFYAADSAHGYELWTSDGTTGGTSLVLDINPGTDGSNPSYYNSLFFAYNGKLYFSAYDATHGYELWVTDGTSAGTSLVKDISPGTGSSYAGYTEGNNGFVILNNKMFFGAQDTTDGWELWQSDGTTSGTTRLADIWPGHGDGDPGYYGGFNLLGNKFYFGADDSVHGTELWVSDGTLAGTQLVKDINPGSGDSYPEYFAQVNNKLYFNASPTPDNYQLCETDGSTSGTKVVSNIYNTGSSGFDPYRLIGFNNQLFFQGIDSTNGWQFYTLNTADSLIQLAPPIAPNPDPLFWEGVLYPFNGSLAFAASFNSIGNELWFYTPVPAAIASVQTLTGINIYPNPFTSQISLTGLQNGIEYHLTLTDIQGREIEQYQITGTGATNTLHLSATLASGMYLLQLSNGEAAETVKIVKE